MSFYKQKNQPIWQRFHIDFPLLCGIGLIVLLSFAVLYSSSSSHVVIKQLIRLGIATCVMLVCAQIPIRYYKIAAPWAYLGTLILLIMVLIVGYTGQGATRWLNLGFMRFQPSEIMKLAMPLLLAYFISQKPIPPTYPSLLICSVLIGIPTFLIASQPDLGTSLLIAASGCFVVLLAGISVKLIIGLSITGIISLPVLWHFLHDYQRQRVLTFLNPESDPLGSGYHIIQSKIAVGSGGLFGKGWFQGTQANLDFLPESSTDFILSVFAEEFGFIGVISLFLIYLFIIFRGLYISVSAQDTFSRLLAGSLTLTFFVYLFVNAGMVIGLLPVVGLPLPLFSYGGTSMVTLMASLGILMSIKTHRHLLRK